MSNGKDKDFKVDFLNNQGKYGYFQPASPQPSVKVPYKTGNFDSIFPDMVESQAKNSNEDIYSQFLRCDTDGNKILSEKEVNKFVKRNELNGELGDIKQGSVGDCLLLGQLIALNEQDWGAQIIKDSMKIDANGNVNITFHIKSEFTKNHNPQAINITVTANEIKNAKSTYFYDWNKDLTEEENWAKAYSESKKEKLLSNGDKDSLAMELALEKCMKKIIGDNFDLKKMDNQEYEQYCDIMQDLVYLLTGHSKHISYDAKRYTYMSKESFEKYPEEAFLFDYIPDYAQMTRDDFIEKYAIGKTNVVWVSFKATDENVISKHCYAIKSIDKDTVRLINPHDSTKIVEMTYDDFKKNVWAIHVFENG